MLAAGRERLDRLVVARGLASTREKARAMILAGEIDVDGRRDLKPGTTVDAKAHLRVFRRSPERVGRGGGKLEGALETFGVAVEGRRALDVGASVGGFTEVLLRRGAKSVIALDVGRGQLDWSLRRDERVLPFEGINARYLDPADLPTEGMPVDLAVCDVSFISLRLILPAIARVLAAAPAESVRREVIVLVKPQFEAGREDVGRGGIVRDPAVRERTVRSVAGSAVTEGFRVLSAGPSAVPGAEGNVEYFLHLLWSGRPGADGSLEEDLREIFPGGGAEGGS